VCDPANGGGAWPDLSLPIDHLVVGEQAQDGVGSL
jgi:hypothetical protein